MRDVVSIGILVADVISKPMTALPEKGKLMPIDSISLHSGGCALSSAVDMSIIGLDTAVVGKIGDDGFGAYLTNVLKAAGVETHALSIGKNSNTSASVVVVGEDSERSFIHCFGANGEFCYEDIAFDFIKEYKIAFFTGVNLMPSLDGKPLGRAVKKAKELGCITVMDTAWDASGRWMELVEDALPHLDYFIPSYDEAANISGKTNHADIAEEFFLLGVKNVAIKLGKDGCYIKTADKKEFTIPTFLNIKAVETTGAGDAFSSGFITGISKGWPLDKCGLFANAVGTFSVSQVGASTGIKSLEETITFIKSEGREW